LIGFDEKLNELRGLVGLMSLERSAQQLVRRPRHYLHRRVVVRQRRRAVSGCRQHVTGSGLEQLVDAG